MKFLIFALLPFAAFAAPHSKSSKAKAPMQMNEQELRDFAQKELYTPPKGAALSPLKAPEQETSLVSTAEVLKEEAEERHSPSEFEVGAQSYRPSGTGILYPTDTYPLDSLSAKPMILVGGRYWFFRSALATSTPWRAGWGAKGGISSNTLQIKTARSTYDNVKFNSFLLSSGPELEYFIDAGRSFAVGVSAQIGKLFAVQSTPTPIMDRTDSASIWEGEAHVRYQPSASLFGRLAYARRGVMGKRNTLSIQEDNYAAFIGFGM